ncbi:phosphoribosylformylglycinamidine synthase subunit PurL, partial [Candidatus Roizmanbacteria bacterium]|nr:phosphoribosylformylglycinamidine synthase subunit PurL [Candidatus Roizmanbacteria bacterium]
DPEKDTLGKSVFYDAQRTIGVPGLTEVRTVKVYRVEGTDGDGATKLAEELFHEPIDQTYKVDQLLIQPATLFHRAANAVSQRMFGRTIFHRPNSVVEIAYKPGVMDPDAGPIAKAASNLGVPVDAVTTSTKYAFYGNVRKGVVDQVVHRLLVNKTVQRIITEKPETLLIRGEPGPVETIPIRGVSDERLMEISGRGLALNVDEMKAIQNYYIAIDRDPTDVELEIFGAYWSEHCVHKTFKSPIEVNGQVKPPFLDRLRTASQEQSGDLVISAYEDNSGVIDFYEGKAIHGKVETHNWPSAREPFGGAATGTGGVVRDILGTGGGARVISSTDMFCLAPPDMDPADVPQGCLHPDYLTRGVVAGVQMYGNNLGVPTNNGSLHFDRRFRARPSVIVGAYGILDKEQAKKGKPQVNDMVVVIGGRTGKDGLHGATFSSRATTEKSQALESTAVQIGNPIEEKRVSDVIDEARQVVDEAGKRGLFHAITDCGAAGLSSAVGEMGEDIGVTIDLKQVLLKYPGLAPWEILLSEAQERMVMAVDPNNYDALIELCTKFNVEATVLGRFDGNHRFNVRYGDQVVADLAYDFLRHGLPKRVLKAHYEKEIFEERAIPPPEDNNGWVDTIKKVLAHGNVCSKQPVVSRYDHGVQGTNALAPFSGVHHDGPNDAVVLTPILGKPYGFVQSHGLNPILNVIDPYHGTRWAIAEACANYVAVGGDITQAAWINNVIWPGTDEKSLGSLDRSIDAVRDCIKKLKVPVVSGKDSLSSRQKSGDEVIDIAPVECISMFGRIPDVAKTVSSDIKNTGTSLYLIGKPDRAMGGSTYYDIHGQIGNEVPKVDLELLPEVYRGMYDAIQTGEVHACHDVSEGGLITTIAEMCFGGDVGVTIDLNHNQEEDGWTPVEKLLNETPSCFVVEVVDDETTKRLFGELPHMKLGTTKQEKTITVAHVGQQLFTASVDELKQAWQTPMQKIFP